MGEVVGVLLGLLSNGLGGTGVGVTRYAVGAIDPVTLGALRFGIGFLVLLPVALAYGGKWPKRTDWFGVAGLGILFFAFYPIVFNLSLRFTTAAHGALALSTIPLLSMLIGAGLGVECLTVRKTLGVFIAMAGVSLALLYGLRSASGGAWIGDLMMILGALCFALYNVLSRPFIARSGAIPFTAMAMGTGAFCLATICFIQGTFYSAVQFDITQWLAVSYLGVIAGAGGFVLWAFALTRTTPTKVAISVPVNPITAAAVSATLLGEPVGRNLIIGLVTVFLGVWIALTDGGPERATAAVAR